MVLNNFQKKYKEIIKNCDVFVIAKQTYRKMTIKDYAILLTGILLGITIVFIWIYIYEVRFLEYFTVETINFHINETKIAELAKEMVIMNK